MPYEPRIYRDHVDPAGLARFEVVFAETDLFVAADRDLTEEALRTVKELRRGLDAYVAAHPRFAESLAPVEVEPSAPAIVREMAEAGRLAGVGPLAAVAGAVAEAVARALAPLSREVIVENGGDVYLITRHERAVRIDAGGSPLSGRVTVRLGSAPHGVAVCTSSATVGPSLSLGSAHAATVVARSGALADAAASMLGNLVHRPSDVQTAVERVVAVPGVLGAVAIAGETMAAAGEISLAPVA
ncbi:UPF0280 family protein [Coriobacteriia bacterium Es71-Z0120]|uniref:UPF0280 family protein n=1 Tax=Parvivirga hydrogeniphila TaxID=2939460 RepID=UPI002260F806|nr:UPF0280 family protein [Parvivirga hydrogeniphila]MCL4078638.1 UPF0280 family protein [Parvivirga hydrogeniphila]